MLLKVNFEVLSMLVNHIKSAEYPTEKVRQIFFCKPVFFGEGLYFF